MSYNIVVITGAGISVESGIQPFRGKDGIWEENPMTMATYRKFVTDPAAFLTWYYSRFKTCLNAKPNFTHDILASGRVRVITQNIDGLHRKANHSPHSLIEIHGCLNEKRHLITTEREDIIPAEWEKVDESNPVTSLFDLFKISKNGVIDQINSYRPHVLLFDEVYTDLYQVDKAMSWILQAEKVIFMGTSNSVGITESALQMSHKLGKEIIVVDPNPSKSFELQGVKIYKISSSEYCKKYFQHE